MFKANEKVTSVNVPGVMSPVPCFQPAAPLEDTPELSAFLRNSTIPHRVRRRNVPVLEPHRQSPAKILVSHLCARRAARKVGLDRIPKGRCLGGVVVVVAAPAAYGCFQARS